MSYAAWYSGGLRSKLTILLCSAIALIELFIVDFSYHHQSSFKKWLHLITIPFVGIQAALIVVTCFLTLFLMSCSKVYKLHPPSIQFAINTLILICVSTLVTNALTFYGDMTCLMESWGYEPEHVYSINPSCFIPLSKVLTYFDSLFFPVILFRGKVMRQAFLD